MCGTVCEPIIVAVYDALCKSFGNPVCGVVCELIGNAVCEPSELLCVNLSKMLCETLCVSTLHIFEILKISFRGHATITLTTLWMGGYSNVYTSK